MSRGPNTHKKLNAFLGDLEKDCARKQEEMRMYLLTEEEGLEVKEILRGFYDAGFCFRLLDGDGVFEYYLSMRKLKRDSGVLVQISGEEGLRIRGGVHESGYVMYAIGESRALGNMQREIEESMGKCNRLLLEEVAKLGD